MASFKSHPIFFTSLILAGSLVAGQAWLLISQRSAVNKVTVEIEQKEQTLANLGRQNPFPSRENLAAVEADRAQAEATLAEIRTVLRANSEVADRIAAATVPQSPTDAYFDIANYLERIRAQANEAQVGYAPDNRFGFATYATTGPERGLIPAVFSQRLYAEYLIGALINSPYPPKEFVSLQRERPITPEERLRQQQGGDGLFGGGGGGGGGGRGEGTDFFSMDARTSARVEGSVETTPFRLTFVGNTSVLRSFLNELALFRVPVVVRSVEVESLAGAANRPTAPRPTLQRSSNLFGDDSTAVNAADAVKPLVEQVDSRFIVTVEIVSLVTKENPDADANDSVAENPL